ncbi:nSTAND1 domain-containing NTPase [Crossiella sp. CA198]|uniref:nSTAND1 domain-containing NTPase n=1 Tax=Crossiella sp. CA198 TaxID=3455607 RepID=UPI003F8D6726
MPRKEQPLVPNGLPLVDFAIELRKLRAAAGQPAYRTLAAATHYSSSTLAAATGGQRLPSLAVTLALVRACGGEIAEWERRWHQVAAQVHEEAPRLPPAAAAPYTGLAPYRREDADRFFGRDQAVADLLARLERCAVVALFGASGAGKSSTLRAGLLPRLGARTAVVFAPGEDPWGSCAQALAGPLGRQAAGLRTELRGDTEALARALRELAGGEAGVLLVVDQFEELFTLCADEADRAGFITALCGAAGERRRVLLGVRSDFYTHCSTHPDLVQVLRAGVVPLGAMSPADLRRAITGPANAAGCAVETDLVAHLVSGAAAEPGVLPLVSHALAETWRRRKGNTLTFAGFQATGGLAHALANTAEAVHDGLTEAQRELCRQLFRRLTAPGEGTEDTKRRVAHTELDHAGTGLAEVVEHFTAARLLVADEHGVELAHEALLHAWPRLRGWLVQDREGLRVQRDLSHAAAEWRRLDRDPGALYRGVRLALARDWDEREQPALSTGERDFLATSQAELAREDTRARRLLRRTRLLAATLVVLLLVATGIAGYAVEQQRTATSRQLSAEARVLLGTDTEAAMRRALAAHAAASTEQSRSMLLLLANTPPEHSRALHADQQFVFAGADPGVLDIQQRRLLLTRTPATVSTQGVQSARNSPKDPDQLAYLYPDQVKLVDRRTGAVLATIPDPPEGANDLGLAADGRQVWLHAPGAAPRQRDFTTGAAGPTLPTRSQTIAVDRAGRLLVTVDQQGQVELWDAVTGASRGRGPGGLGEVRVLALHQDGRFLAAGGAQGRTTVFDLERGTVAAELADQGGTVSDLAYGIDPNVLVVVQQGRVRWWDSRGDVALTLSGDRGDFLGATFDPTGRVVLGVNGLSNTVWDQWRLPLVAGSPITQPLAFSADGQTLRAGTGTQQLSWPLRPAGPFRGTPRPPLREVVVDREHTVALGPRGEALVLWDLRQDRQLGELPASLGGNGALSPDGATAAISTPTAVRLYRVHDQARLAELPSGEIEPATGVVFAPDNRNLAWIRRAGPAVLWDQRSNREHVLGTDHPRRVVFAPGGRFVLTVTDDDLQVWEVATGRRTARLALDRAHSLTHALSPDGRTLALAGAGRAIEVWDLPTQTRTATLDGPQPLVHLATWNDEGTVLATAGTDTTVVRWNLGVAAARRSLCEALTEDFVSTDGTPLPPSCP